jgi:hypothetical protein
LNAFEDEVLKREVSGINPPGMRGPAGVIQPGPQGNLRNSGSLDPHTLGSYKKLSNVFGTTTDRAGNVTAGATLPTADEVRRGQLTARIAGQNAQLSDVLGTRVDRLGNVIAAPAMPAFFKDGGEVTGSASLDDYLQQQMAGDSFGDAQKLMANFNEVPKVEPMRRIVKRVSRGAGGDSKTDKNMSIKVPPLAASKEMTFSKPSAQEAAETKSPGTAREQMEELARVYQLKINAAKNKARGLGADTFGAPTLESPTLVKKSLTKRRFAEGGEVKKSEADDLPQVTGINRVVDFIAQRLPAGVFPTAGRTLLETVQGKRDPITESSFSKDELEVLRQLASKNQGAVRYKDYDALAQELRSKGKEADATASLFSLGSPLGNVRNTLGQFTYKLDPKGNLVVEDAYDFNPPGAPGQTREARTADYGTFGPYNMIREYAGEKVPPGKGRPVRVNLGKPSNKK